MDSQAPSGVYPELSDAEQAAVRHFVEAGGSLIVVRSVSISVRIACASC